MVMMIVIMMIILILMMTFMMMMMMNYAVRYMIYLMPIKVEEKQMEYPLISDRMQTTRLVYLACSKYQCQASTM